MCVCARVCCKHSSVTQITKSCLYFGASGQIITNFAVTTRKGSQSFHLQVGLVSNLIFPGFPRSSPPKTPGQNFPRIKCFLKSLFPILTNWKFYQNELFFEPLLASFSHTKQGNGKQKRREHTGERREGLLAPAAGTRRWDSKNFVALNRFTILTLRSSTDMCRQ